MASVALRHIPLLVAALATIAACTVKESDDEAADGGSGGTAATGGSGGSTGGSGGSTGGTSGDGGTGGVVPTAGAAGAAGEPVTAGAAGEPVTAGAAGTAGEPVTAGGGGAPGGAGGLAGSPPVGSHTVSGSLQVSSQMFLDSDTNDPNNLYDTNDDIGVPWLIGNPCSVSGYLGPIDNPPAPNSPKVDANDWYDLDMSAGQTITLYIGTPGDGSPVPDFNLRLRDGSGTLVSTDEGTSPVKIVEAQSTGRHFVRVYSPVSETGLYTLIVGTAASANVARGMAPERMSSLWPMVEGEAVVMLESGAQVMDADQLRTQLGVTAVHRPSPVTGHRRVRFDLPKGLGRTGSALDRAEATIQAIKRLRRSPLVRYAEPNYIRQAFAPPVLNDPLFDKQWHYTQINLVDAWQNATGEYPPGTHPDPNAVIVAVLDTGVVLAHPDIQGQLVPGYDMVSSPSFSGDDDGIDDDPNDPGDEAYFSDSTWHGTHCAGTVAAATGNAEGCAGVAPDAKVMPVRVLGRGGGTNYDIAQGILFAAGLSNDSNTVPARKADIISMSLGGPGYSQLMQDAIDAAIAEDVIVIAAAGNDDIDASNIYPVANTGVIGVSAVDRHKQKTSYSNYGSVIDIAAPGGVSFDQSGDGLDDNVYSLVWSNQGQTLYKGMSGTSMACPHVAGVAALMKSAFPAMTPADFAQLVAGTHPSGGAITEDLGNANLYGSGLINASLAVRAAMDAAGTPAPDTPVLHLSTHELDFGSDAATTQLGFSIENRGGSTLDPVSCTYSQPWILSVQPCDWGMDGPQVVTIDHSSPPAGIYTGQITVDTAGGTDTVDVRMVMGTTTVEGGADIGVVYVLLWDVNEDAPAAGVDQAQTSLSDSFAFTLTNVPTGDYRIYAGTDYDCNLYIDDDSEAFGSYPGPGSTQPFIHVDGDVSGQELTLAFLLNLQAASADGAPARVPRIQRIR